MTVFAGAPQKPSRSGDRIVGHMAVDLGTTID